MTNMEQDIAGLMEDIWMSTLGLTTRPAESGGGEVLSGATLDGIIHITGDWQGAVAVQVPRAMAALIASKMLSLGDVPPTLEDMQDALGEVTNMTGGNIKTLMPGSCHLSLPAVVEGMNYSIRVPSAQVISRLVMECEGLPAVVSLMAVSPRHA